MCSLDWDKPYFPCSHFFAWDLAHNRVFNFLALGHWKDSSCIICIILKLNLTMISAINMYPKTFDDRFSRALWILVAGMHRMYCRKRYKLKNKQILIILTLCSSIMRLGMGLVNFLLNYVIWESSDWVLLRLAAVHYTTKHFLICRRKPANLLSACVHK